MIAGSPFSSLSACFSQQISRSHPQISFQFLACEVSLTIRHPCMKSPCGPYSQCRNVDMHAVCSCLPGYVGSPPACRPQCVVSSECPLDKSCVNQLCTNPCQGMCGHYAICQVINHNRICSCRPGYTGDAFNRCIKEQRKNTFRSI